MTTHHEGKNSLQVFVFLVYFFGSTFPLCNLQMAPHGLYLKLNDVPHPHSPAGSCPNLHRDHGLFGTDGGKEVLLGQKLERELHHEATDLFQLLSGLDRVLALQTGFGKETTQLQDAPDVTGREATENLHGTRVSG